MRRCRSRRSSSGSWTGSAQGRSTTSRCGSACVAGSTPRRSTTRCRIWCAVTRSCAPCSRSTTGSPIVRVHAALELPLPRIDLSAVSAAEERDAAAQRLSIDDALAPFDLAHGPLVRASLLELGDAEHLLLLTMHHIVTDGGSTAIVLRDLSALYAARVDGRASTLPELPIQYLDFAAWQRQWLSGELLDELVGYWRTRLAGAPESLDLPADRALPPHRQRKGGRPHGSTSRRSSASSSARSPRAIAPRCAPPAWPRSRSCSSATAGRTSCSSAPRSPTARTATSTRSSATSSTSSWSAAIWLAIPRSTRTSRAPPAAMTRDLDHKQLPLGALVAALWPNRDPLGAALIQAMFDHIEDPSGAMQLGGVAADLIDTMNHFAGLTNADFALTLVERRGELRCMWEYAADLFDAGTIQHVAESYVALLEAIALHPERRLSRLPVLSAAQRRRLLERERPPHPAPAPLVPPSFAAAAARWPEAIAVEHRGARITYRELAARVHQLAHRLVALGVGPEARVACLLPPSIDAIVALLAILEAGGAYLPLDPTYPKTWVERVAADAQPVAVIGIAETLAAQGLAIPAVSLDDERERLAALSDRPLDRAPRADALAYVIYTSGSSGTPKGVQVTHAGLAHHCRAIIEDHYFLRPDDRVLQFNTLSFDPSIEEIVPTLPGRRVPRHPGRADRLGGRVPPHPARPRDHRRDAPAELPAGDARRGGLRRCPDRVGAPRRHRRRGRAPRADPAVRAGCPAPP